MNKSFKQILSAIGIILHVPGIMAIISMLVSVIFKEYAAITGFAIVAAITIIPGQILYRNFQGRRLFLKQSMATAAIGWLLVSLAGSVPFLYWAETTDFTNGDVVSFTCFINAFFESVSGFTSTGLTMAETPSELSHSIQWWRTFMQWVGGAGIVVFIAGISKLNVKPLKTPEEQHNESETLPAINLTWDKIWWIYILITLFAISWLMLKNVPAWEAVNHGMSAVCTGGFTITDNSLRTYDPGLFAGIIVMMIIGSLNFNSYRQLLIKFKWKSLVFNREVIIFFLLAFAGAGMLLATDFNQNTSDKMFQMASALGTCGFQTTDIASWPSSMLALLIVAMFIGGTNGSTTGGIKIFRLIYLFKGIGIYFKHLALPEFKRKQHTEWQKSGKIWKEISIFLLMWLVLYAVSGFILAKNVPEEYTFSQVLFETTSAISCVGLSTGITEAGLNLVAKINIIVTMFLGRLELIPIILLTSMLLPRKSELLHAEDVPSEDTGDKK